MDLGRALMTFQPSVNYFLARNESTRRISTPASEVQCFTWNLTVKQPFNIPAKEDAHAASV